MNLFDQLVTQALENNPTLSSLRIVVEKELLHHDILRIMSRENLLLNLTFIGGTCLRTCYGAQRLSEDLDFTGGSDFTRESLLEMGEMITQKLEEKYSLSVRVREPVKDINNVDTWKILIETRPEVKHMAAQRIHIDICSVPSYERKPMLLLNPYGIDMGTSGLIIQAQSREEIYTDKLLAFALRPNRIKYRDLWDIAWLHQSNIQPRLELIRPKLQDREISKKHYMEVFRERIQTMTDETSHKKLFTHEMERFLPSSQIENSIHNDMYWDVIAGLMKALYEKIEQDY